MGNLLNTFVSSGALNLPDPAGAKRNALAAKAQQQTNEMNALKLKDYPADKESAQKQQEFSNKMQAYTAAASATSDEQADAVYKSLMPNDPNPPKWRIDENKNVTMELPDGSSISGPQKIFTEYTQQVAQDPTWATDETKSQKAIAWFSANGGTIKRNVASADTAATLKQREKESIRGQVSDISKAATAAEEAEANRANALNIAKIGAQKSKDVANINAMSKIDIKKLDQEIKKVTSDKTVPANVKVALATIAKYKSSSSSNAFEQVIANALSGNSEDTSIIAAGRQELSGTEQTIYDQAVKTVYEYFSGQGGSTAAGVTPEVGKVYVDANGNKAKYLGPGQWEAMP
jgi:hypothetical protein